MKHIWKIKQEYTTATNTEIRISEFFILTNFKSMYEAYSIASDKCNLHDGPVMHGDLISIDYQGQVVNSE